MKDWGVCIGCALVLWGTACTRIDVPIPAAEPDATAGDSELDCGDPPCDTPPARPPSLIVQSSGHLQGSSQNYRLRLSAGLPQPHGTGESQRFRVLLGPEGPYERSGAP